MLGKSGLLNNVEFGHELPLLVSLARSCGSRAEHDNLEEDVVREVCANYRTVANFHNLSLPACFEAHTVAQMAMILRDSVADDSTVRRKIEEAILSASRQLTENATARTEINAFFGGQVLASILAARPHARALVISTINAWDAKEMADMLDGTVGRDLQFIRLNGTIVGGLMGVVIYGVFWFFGK
jgi:hypothetical protein